MKIFSTGATGFIGSHFINEAHKVGHELYCVKRENSKPRVELEKEPHWIIGDLSGNYVDILKHCDLFLHMATFGATPQPANWIDCVFWNVQSLLNLLIQSEKAQIQNYIILGSYAEYGTAGLRYEYIPCDAPLEPIGPYPTSKALASNLAWGFCAEHGLNLKILRLFWIFIWKHL